MSDDPLDQAAGSDPAPLVNEQVIAAMNAGAPWWLALEAVASTNLDRDPRAQTQSLSRARRLQAEGETPA